MIKFPKVARIRHPILSDGETEMLLNRNGQRSFIAGYMRLWVWTSEHLPMIKALKMIIFGVVLCSCSACADLQQNSPQGRSSIQVWLFQRRNLSDLGVASTAPLTPAPVAQAAGRTRGESSTLRLNCIVSIDEHYGALAHSSAQLILLG
jgi:hypothetical protein